MPNANPYEVLDTDESTRKSRKLQYLLIGLFFVGCLLVSGVVYFSTTARAAAAREQAMRARVLAEKVRRDSQQANPDGSQDAPTETTK